MSFREPQNPGLSGLDELTDTEEYIIMQIASLGFPLADRILFYDKSSDSYNFLSLGDGLSITDTTLTATASSMIYPGSGIAVSTGSAWGTSITGTSSQFVKADGTLDSNTYLTGNQSITLSGDITGTGTTGITTTLANGAVDIAHLSATGTPSSSTYLRGDNTWATITAGGGTLDSAYDYGGTGSGRSITADSGAVEITVPDTSNNVGLIINQNDTTNNPVSIHTISATTNYDVTKENIKTIGGLPIASVKTINRLT